MNEKRFIELVNLYIDHEISPPELEELENEVAHNAQRRQVYHEYCRLQLASQTACQEFRASLVRSVDLRKYQILARESRSRSRIALFYSAGALAAACFTVFAATSVFTNQKIAGGEAEMAATETGSATVVEVFNPSSAETRVARVPSAGVPAPKDFASYRVSRGNEMLSAARSSVRNGFQFSVFPTNSSWTEDYRTGSASRVFQSGSSFETREWGTVQFQR